MKRPIPICYKCGNRMLQQDLFDKSKERVVGCKRMTGKEWSRGLRADAKDQPEYQHDCPLLR
jgi:hypothetical protein